MTYEAVRKYVTPEGDKDPSAPRKLLAGATSGAVAQTCTYPLYVDPSHQGWPGEKNNPDETS